MSRYPKVDSLSSRALLCPHTTVQRFVADCTSHCPDRGLSVLYFPMYIRKLVSLTILGALSLAVSVQAAAPVSLFDGKTLNGWVQNPANSWTVTNGVMTSKGISGEIFTTGSYSRYRIIFSHFHHISATGNHYGSALVFCKAPPPLVRGLQGVQFGIPNGWHWDYRPGHNNWGAAFFTVINSTSFAQNAWSRVEILVDGRTGIARMAVAQPVGTKAIEVLQFKDPAVIGSVGPVAFQIHNNGLIDEYKDITIEVDPAINDLITTGTITPPLEQVADPVITPPTGTYTAAQTVTLTTATAGATIRYTVDGTTPTTTTGSVYSAPFVVNKTTSVQAVAFKSGMTASNLAKVDLTIDSGNTGTVFQAESGTLSGGAIVESVNAGFKGSGYINFQASGSTLTFGGLSGNGGGAKTITVRYALGAATRTGVIIVNGVSQPITFPSTGSWTTWAEDVKVNVTLNNNGANSIQFASTGGDLANIDQITLLPTQGSTPHTLQAEAATLAGGTVVETIHAGFNGTGYINVGLNAASATFSNVDGNGGGSKNLSIRFALGTAARTGKLVVNGVSTNVSFPSTGSWTTWQTLVVPITLNAGASNTIQFVSTGADLANIDEITIP